VAGCGSRHEPAAAPRPSSICPLMSSELSP
jgi:hypothetical protein